MDPEHHLDVHLHSRACLSRSGGPPGKELSPERTWGLASRQAQLRDPGAESAAEPAPSDLPE